MLVAVGGEGLGLSLPPAALQLCPHLSAVLISQPAAPAWRVSCWGRAHRPSLPLGGFSGAVLAS